MQYYYVKASDNRYEVFLMPDGEKKWQGVVDKASANIANFVGVCVTLAYQLKENTNYEIYTNNASALAWIRDKECFTQEKTEVVKRAEEFLRSNDLSNFVIRKWDSEKTEIELFERRLEEVKNFFESKKHEIPQNIQLSQCERIVNVQKFIENSISFCENQNIKVAINSLERLEKLKKIVENNGRI